MRPFGLVPHNSITIIHNLIIHSISQPIGLQSTQVPVELGQSDQTGRMAKPMSHAPGAANKLGGQGADGCDYSLIRCVRQHQGVPPWFRQTRRRRDLPLWL